MKCGEFHEMLPGDDSFCDYCRPKEDHPSVIKAVTWWTCANTGKAIPERGTKEWGKMLNDWARLQVNK